MGPSFSGCYLHEDPEVCVLSVSLERRARVLLHDASARRCLVGQPPLVGPKRSAAPRDGACRYLGTVVTEGCLPKRRQIPSDTSLASAPLLYSANSVASSSCPVGSREAQRHLQLLHGSAQYWRRIRRHSRATQCRQRPNHCLPKVKQTAPEGHWFAWRCLQGL